MGRMASPRYYTPPPMFLENGLIATIISFTEGLLRRQAFVIALFTEYIFSFSKRLGFGLWLKSPGKAVALNALLYAYLTKYYQKLPL
jgi:hypothetical protein